MDNDRLSFQYEMDVVVLFLAVFFSTEGRHCGSIMGELKVGRGLALGEG